MHYQKLSRELNSTCNICGNLSTLTWDHVPPKNSFNCFPIKYNPLLIVQAKDEIVKEATSQNGVKFRTICSQCNNELLGKEYDPAMKQYSEFLRKYLIEEIDVPEELTVKIKINRLCRAICGHLIAALVPYDNIINLATKYFLKL